jgi:hypothetical protein
VFEERYKDAGCRVCKVLCGRGQLRKSSRKSSSSDLFPEPDVYHEHKMSAAFLCEKRMARKGPVCSVKGLIRTWPEHCVCYQARPVKRR